MGIQGDSQLPTSYLMAHSKLCKSKNSTLLDSPMCIYDTLVFCVIELTWVMKCVGMHQNESS